MNNIIYITSVASLWLVTPICKPLACAIEAKENRSKSSYLLLPTSYLLPSLPWHHSFANNQKEDMKLLTSLAGGLAGAITVTILHELIRKIDPSAPRLDKLGEEATARVIQKTGHVPPLTGDLYVPALVGDIVGNTLYYSLAGTRIKKAMTTGGILGLGAGLGALKLPGALGLNGAHTNQTNKRRWITVGLYVAGGLIAAGVTKWLENKASRKMVVARTKAPDEAYKPILDITV